MIYKPFAIAIVGLVLFVALGFFPLMILLFVLTVSVIIYQEIKKAINNRRCPECKTLNLTRTYQVLIPATTGTSGKRYVTHHCGTHIPQVFK